KERGEHHVAAVAGAVNGHTPGVEPFIRPDPGQKGADISHGVLTPQAVVHGQKCLPEPGRTPDVRVEQRDAFLLEEEIPSPLKDRARLRFRTSMQNDEDRTWAGK